MGDLIQNLPTDQNDPNVNTEDIKRIEGIFLHGNDPTVNMMKEEARTVAMVAASFLASTYAKSLINQIIPLTVNSEIALVIIQAILAGLVFYLLQNVHLMRK